MTGAYHDVITADEDWQDSASCRGTSLGLWFPERSRRRHDPVRRALVTMAKQICKECPVRRECLDWALDTGEPYGIYGGMTEKERANLLRRGA